MVRVHTCIRQWDVIFCSNFYCCCCCCCVPFISLFVPRVLWCWQSDSTQLDIYIGGYLITMSCGYFQKLIRKYDSIRTWCTWKVADATTYCNQHHKYCSCFGWIRGALQHQFAMKQLRRPLICIYIDWTILYRLFALADTMCRYCQRVCAINHLQHTNQRPQCEQNAASEYRVHALKETKLQQIFAIMGNQVFGFIIIILCAIYLHWMFGVYSLCERCHAVFFFFFFFLLSPNIFSPFATISRAQLILLI